MIKKNNLCVCLFGKRACPDGNFIFQCQPSWLHDAGRWSRVSWIWSPRSQPCYTGVALNRLSGWIFTKGRRKVQQQDDALHKRTEKLVPLCCDSYPPQSTAVTELYTRLCRSPPAWLGADSPGAARLGAEVWRVDRCPWAVERPLQQGPLCWGSVQWWVLCIFKVC